MTVKKIDSENNATFKLFLKLTTARGIKKNGLALLSGPKQVGEMLREFSGQCAGLIFPDGMEPPADATSTGIPFYCLKAAIFRQIDIYNTEKPILLIRVEPFLKWDDKYAASGCTLCVPFQDPANVGAVMRSAAAFGVSRSVLLKEAAHPFHPKSVKVAGSALFRIPIFEGPSLSDLKTSETQMITLSPAGTDVKGFKFPDSFLLIPGLEGPGLPDHLHKETCLSIPMESGVESINAAMATGIILYMWRSQLGAGD